MPPALTLFPGAKESVPFSNCFITEPSTLLKVAHVGLRADYRPWTYFPKRSITQEFYANEIGLNHYVWYSYPFVSMKASEQDKYGSIVVIDATKDKIILAADSRVLHGDMLGNKQASDDECKITALKGDVVLGVAGRKGHQSAGHPEFTWDSFAIAYDVANGISSSPDRIRDIAAEWGKRVAALHNRDAARGVIGPMGAGKEGIENAIFAGFQAGKTTAFTVDILLSPTGSGPYFENVKGLDLQDGFVLGIGVLDTCFEWRQTERGKVWFNEFMSEHPKDNWDSMAVPLLERIIELTIRYSVHRDEVGEPIDIIEITPTGTHWIKKKANCGN